MRISKPLTLALALSAGMGAADFWEKKNFAAWNRSEVQKMLSDSPWAKPVLISSESTGGALQPGVERREPPPNAAGCATCTDRAPHVSVASIEMPRIAANTAVIVRWQTALPVKQAIARARFGDEVATSAAAREFLEREEDGYVISLEGIPAHLAQADPDQVKSRSSLRAGDASPVFATQVQASAGGATFTLYLVFPKSPPGGSPITLAHKEVEVDVKLASLTVKRKFKLKDMVYGGKLTL